VPQVAWPSPGPRPHPAVRLTQVDQDPAAPGAEAPDAYLTLYRRFRPQRFDEVVGQDHVTRALRNSVRQGRTSHAYLFSGPRGTGKTSTARILAKALNCRGPEDGEPCGACPSCLAVAAGSSLDVHELDAASNNGVEAMRDLVARAALGSPGRWKVYIVDEVHMLSAAASNALLKTLEEPPSHVVFVLATTDPQKVLPTIRSRASHFEFRLLGRPVLAELVERVRRQAGLELPEGAVEVAVHRANGSARDALSALDQLAALGSVEDEVPVLDELVEAICQRDAGAALARVAEALAAGRDATRLASDLVEHLREGFLSTMAPELVSLGEGQRERVAQQAARLGPAALVRAMEALGSCLVDMRDCLDPRVLLEVALVRICRPEADDSAAGLLERLERLEARLDALGSPDAGSLAPQAPAPRPAPAGPAGARAALGALRRRPEATLSPSAPASPPPAPEESGPSSQGPLPSGRPGRRPPSREELTTAWGDKVLASLRPRARALFGAGRFVGAGEHTAEFALPDEVHRSRCQPLVPEVEDALGAHFGCPVRLSLVVDDGSPARPDPPEEDDLDPDSAAEPVRELAPVHERLLEVFPGAEEV